MASPVPKLPGYAINVPPSLEGRPLTKKQTLTYTKGYPHEAGTPLVCDIKGPPSPDLITSHTYGSPKAGSGSPAGTTLPHWVTNDRKVLRFYGYYQESVPESRVETHRVRKVVVYYYLADDSLHVAEPCEDNSGLTQGVVLKRHRVPRNPAAPDAGFLRPGDLAVGLLLPLYGRTLLLTDADAFTRSWYESELGMEQGAPLEAPPNPVDAYREAFGFSGKHAPKSNELATFAEAMHGKPSHLLDGGGERLAQFLANAGKVLRFWCVWDDRAGMYGDRRPLVLHYYLEDGSVEVNEQHARNTGRDPAPGFVKRAPLPKEAPRTRALAAGRPPASACYAPADFRLGATIRVHGRDLLLHDCDAFTRGWYQSELGFSEEMLAPVDVREPVEPLPRPALPPPNGFGSPEDSRQNCIALLPKPPKKDMHKLMNKDKIVLRFTARMTPTPRAPVSSADASRVFVVSVFLMDDTITLFEPPVRNSGIVGGKFLERQKIYKPGSEEIYTCQDLHVGATLVVFSRPFTLTGADEYTLTFMENNRHLFLMADAGAAAEALSAQAAGREDAVRKALEAAAGAPGCGGCLDDAQLAAALESAGLRITQHQALALRRRLDPERTGSAVVGDVLAALGLGP